jgi:hypothetical protein
MCILRSVIFAYMRSIENIRSIHLHIRKMRSICRCISIFCICRCIEVFCVHVYMANQAYLQWVTFVCVCVCFLWHTSNPPDLKRPSRNSADIIKYIYIYIYIYILPPNRLLWKGPLDTQQTSLQRSLLCPPAKKKGKKRNLYQNRNLKALYILSRPRLKGVFVQSQKKKHRKKKGRTKRNEFIHFLLVVFFHKKKWICRRCSFIHFLLIFFRTKKKDYHEPLAASIFFEHYDPPSFEPLAASVVFCSGNISDAVVIFAVVILVIQ